MPKDLLSTRVAKKAVDLQISSKVAQRILAGVIPMGSTFQNEKIRIHRYRDQVRVTDLTNAGKKGKKVPELNISLTYNYTGDQQGWFDRQTEKFKSYATSSSKPYAAIQAFIKDLQHDYPDDIKMSESEYKGVDIEPYGELFKFKVPFENGSSLTVESSPINSLVRHTAEMTGPNGNSFDHDTLYYPDKKKDAAIFYGWMKDNSAKVKTFKSLLDLLEVWKSLGVNYDYH